MKTTTQIVDEEHEFLREKGYLAAEKYEMETLLMREVFELGKVEIGEVRKHRKNVQHATVTRGKLPRFIRVQFNNRRIQAAPEFWNRS